MQLIVAFRWAASHAAAAPLPSPPPQAGRLQGREPFYRIADFGAHQILWRANLSRNGGGQTAPSGQEGARGRGRALPRIAHVLSSLVANDRVIGGADGEAIDIHRPTADA
jgi:hypothetical protein